MACMNGSELVAYTREYIHEANPDFWTPERLLASMNTSMKRVVLKMQKMADRVFYTSCTIPIVAGTQKYALPDGVLYIDPVLLTAAPKCTGKVDHLFNALGDEFGKADFRLIHKAVTGTPANIVLVGNWIYLDRVPTASENATLWYWYFPAAITAGATPIDFLEGYEEWIALETAKKSLIKDEAALEDIRLEIAEIQQEFVNTYCGSRHEGEPDEIQEDVLDPD